MLKSHFPQVIKDSKLNVETITNLLDFENKIAESKKAESAKESAAQDSKNSDSGDSGDSKLTQSQIDDLKNIQGYELTWTGKGIANAMYSAPTQELLKLESTQSKEADSTNNAIIIGDNIDALKLLKAAYYGKIKMIYIDPPYNTKNENFIYPDNFREDYIETLRKSGLLKYDDNGKEVESSELNFLKNILGTKSHSGWLSFMLPRLKLARDLLKSDGVIFISIDDNEQANLKILCDEIFGEDNFIETFLWNKTQTPPSASNKTRKTHEFIMCYQKYKDNKKMVARFAGGGDAPLWNETNSERILSFPGNYVATNLPNGIYKKGVRDKIELLDNVEVVEGKITNLFRLKGHFRWKQETLEKEIENNVYLVVKSNKFSIRYCREEERIVMPTNEISKRDGVGTNETASKELEKLMGAKVFSFNKPTSLIEYLIKIATNADTNDIVMDFFAGSGTTAHAVMELNAADNGNRQFILVQKPEEIDESKSKAAFDFCKNTLDSKSPKISDITIERVKRAAKNIEKNLSQSLVSQKIDLGFRVFSLDKKPAPLSDKKDTLKLYTKNSLTPLDKAINLALQSGKTLDKKLVEILKDRLYKCEDSYYLVKCDKEAMAILSDIKPVLFIDGYGDISLEDFLNLNLNANLNVIY
ncbi:hypothetical protein CCY99_02230 [Helicobacter sp. 16-1353]|nr:hypothetical protein CCY99_02230 [Helicobacter sp. 16-1353]